MSEFDRLKELSNYSLNNISSLFEISTPDYSGQVDKMIEKSNKERVSLELEKSKREAKKERQEEERHESKIEELKKSNMILLESHKELTIVNKNLEKQISSLEEALRNQDKELDFLKSESADNAKEAKFSKWISIISTIIAGVSLWVSIGVSFRNFLIVSFVLITVFMGVKWKKSKKN